MSTLARPPADLSCHELFATWLPGAFARARAAGAAAPDLSVAVRLDGEGGGRWTLRGAGGALTVVEGDDGAPVLITLSQSVADFRAAIWGEGDTASLLPPQLDLAAVVTGQAQVPTTALSQVKGTLHVEIPGFAGRTWAAAIGLGGAATPSATVTADVPTLEAMRAGTLPPAQAFFAGKIAVTGDVPWLMQVGMSLAGGGLA